MQHDDTRLFVTRAGSGEYYVIATDDAPPGRDTTTAILTSDPRFTFSSGDFPAARNGADSTLFRVTGEELKNALVHSSPGNSLNVLDPAHDASFTLIRTIDLGQDREEVAEDIRWRAEQERMGRRPAGETVRGS